MAKKWMLAVTPWLLACAAWGGDATLRGAGGGLFAFDNGVVEFDLSSYLGSGNGVTRFVLSPNTEMSDRNRLHANFLGEIWDSCNVGDVPGGAVLPLGGVYAPVARAFAEGGEAVGLRQEYRGDWQVTRTVSLRKGRSAAVFEYELANRSGTPVGGAFRFFSAPFPGVLPGTTEKSTSVFVPTVDGVKELDQAIHRSAYHERYGKGHFFLPAWDEGEPLRWWTKRELTTPRLNGNWAAEINRNNGYGIIVFVDRDTLIGFYNDPQTTLETVIRACALGKGEHFRTRVTLGAFRMPRGQTPTAANELFLTCPGGLLPLFKGVLEIDGRRHDADPQTLIAVTPPPAGFGHIRAFDGDGRLAGTFDGGKVEMAPDGLDYRAPEKPQFAGDVYDPEPAAGETFVAGRNFTVYCHYANHPDTRARAKEIARTLGVGYAEHLPEGEVLVIGSGEEDESCRIIGGMQNSVTDQWPAPGQGAIRFFPILELTGKPALVLAGRDRAGLEKALARWSGPALKDAVLPSSWRARVVPTSEKIFRWSRPGPEAMDAIAFSAAKGEYESAQILVVPDVAVKDFSVTVSPFVHAESGKPLAGDFATATRKRFGHARVRFVDYFPYDPKPEVKAWPDPLFDRARTTLDTGEAQGLWFTFFIPEAAEAGRYRAEITLRGNGETKTIPVEATVRNFTLLRDALWGEAYANLGSIPKKGASLRPPHIESYISTLVEHGMRMIRLSHVNHLFRIQGDPKGSFAGLDHPAYEKSDDGRILLDCTEFDRIVDLSERHGRPFTLAYTVPVEEFIYEAQQLKNLLPGRHADREGNALLNNRYLEEALILFRRHLEKRNWFERVYLGVSDEPGNAREWIEKFCQPAIHSGLKFTTAHGSSNLSDMDPGLCAIWKPIYASYDPEFMAKARAAGSKIAFYNCGPPPTTAIGAPAREWRNYLWQAAKYDLDMVSWWGIQSWGYGLDGNEAVWRQYSGHWNYLLYPEHPLQPSYFVAGKGWMDVNLIESIRWEVIRDGMEDANYVYLLRKLCRQARDAGKGAEAEAAEHVLEDLWTRHWPDRNAYRVDMAELLTAREAVAEQIERLAGILD